MPKIADYRTRSFEFALLAAIVFPLLLMPMGQENDLGFLLSDGRYILEQGFPVEDPFTMHQGMHFIMQQWLSAVIFWLCYANFGVNGLFALIALTGAAITYLYFRLIMTASQNNRAFSLLMMLTVGILFSLIFFRIRPQMFSALLLLMAVLALEKYQIRKLN